MLDASGTVRVLDLGLARLLGDSSPVGSSTPHHLTRPGVYMGTVDFMAPEQAEDSHNVDHRADIYSLGCSLYFLLTGRPPFQGETAISRLMAHQSEPPPSIRKTRPDLPRALETAYLAMMGKRPEDRPQSMADVIARLDSCRSSSSGSVHLSLHSFSSTVLEKNALVPAALNPTIVRGRDSSGGTSGSRPSSTPKTAGPRIDLASLRAHRTSRHVSTAAARAFFQSIFGIDQGERPRFASRPS